MTRTKQSEVASPRELQRISKDQRAQAKKKAIELVEKALESHILTTQDSNNFVSAICKAISADESEVIKNRKKRVHSSTEANTEVKNVVNKKKGRSNSFDDHDEICEVCEKGGDLLCCDTCTLVFHLKCIRPKLNGIPKGSWSCSHCIIEDLADGDVRAAKSSLRLMNRLARGIDSDDESSFTGGTGPAEAADPLRTSSVGEFLVVRKGKKFVLKQMERKQLVDVGKYLSLEEALNYIKEGEFTAQKEAAEKAAAAAAASKKPKKESLSAHSSLSSLSLKRRRSSTDLKGGDLSTERDDASSSEGRASKKSEEVSSSSREKVDKDRDRDSDAESSTGYDELWCSHCLDDKHVTVCVFCGCKKCYGKYDSSLLILCDHCERETHTYCLDPPLSAVPETDPWYCQSCTLDGIPEIEPAEEEEEEAEEGEGLSLGESDGDFGLGFDGDAAVERQKVKGSGRKRTWSHASHASNSSVVDWSSGLKKIRALSENDDSMRGNRAKLHHAKGYPTSASASSALGHHLVDGPTKHRGRGRPPGSGKRATSTTPTTTGLGSAMSTLPDYSTLKPPKPTRGDSSGGHEFTNKSRRSKSLGWDEGDFDFGMDDDYGDFDLLAEGHNPFESPSKMEVVEVEGELEGLNATSSLELLLPTEEVRAAVVEEVFELGAVGIRAALQVIQRASVVSGKVDNGPWTLPELDLLEQVRVWAPVCDLERAVAALQEQKETLVKRIQAQDASFDCKELEALIAAQLADARCTENALLQAQLGAGGDTAALASAAAAAVIAPAPLGLAAAAVVVVVKPKRISKPKPSVAPKTAEKVVKKTTGGPTTTTAPAAPAAPAAVPIGTTFTGTTGITATGVAMNTVPAILASMPMVVPLSVPLSVPAPVSTMPMPTPVPVAAQRVSGPPASAPAPTVAAEPAVSALTSVPEVV